jgi:spore germination cell wall hydrolase CwlJ-like protein
MNPRQLTVPLAVGAVVAALLAAAPASRSAAADPDDGREIACLALTIYHEARGEPERGKLAVGHVVMNRTHSALFPASVCDVVQQGGVQRHRCQFSWWCDGRSDRPTDQAALRESMRLAEEIYYGCTPDPTAGALWYHATDVRPSWSKSFGPGKRIDGHVFYRGDLDRPIRIGVSSSARGQCPPARETRPTLLAGS